MFWTFDTYTDSIFKVFKWRGNLILSKTFTRIVPSGTHVSIKKESHVEKKRHSWRVLPSFVFLSNLAPSREKRLGEVGLRFLKWQLCHWSCTNTSTADRRLPTSGSFHTSLYPVNTSRIHVIWIMWFLIFYYSVLFSCRLPVEGIKFGTRLILQTLDSPHLTMHAHSSLLILFL